MFTYAAVFALAAAAAAQSTVSAPSGQNQTQVNCYAAYNQCRGAPDANFSFCASQYAQCLGFSPFNEQGTNTVTPVISAPAPSSTVNATVVACQNQYDTCRTTPVNGASANQAFCASQYASCLGYSPFGPDGSNTVTRTPSSAVASSTAAPSASASVLSCADQYNVCRQPTNGVSANQAFCAAQNAECKGKCQSQYDTCRTTRVDGLSANQAACAAAYAGCLGENPFATSSSVNAYTTQVVTEYTTVCPSPTTFTHGPSTYTVKSSTVITIPCPGGCTVTKPVETHPAVTQPAASSAPSPLTTVVRPSNNVGVPTPATTTSRAVYTGAAVKVAGPGAILVGALGLLAL